MPAQFSRKFSYRVQNIIDVVLIDRLLEFFHVALSDLAFYRAFILSERMVQNMFVLHYRLSLTLQSILERMNYRIVPTKTVMCDKNIKICACTIFLV